MVALQGPSFTTVSVNLITSVTTMSVTVTLTVLLIFKSTIGSAVMLGMLALLLDLLVSFSVLVTLTALVMFPTEVTLASITN